MKIIRPQYYDTFRCIAAACPDSCCKEWAVVVDEDKAAFYRSLPGELGDRLRQVLCQEDGEIIMAIENGRCPMWRADGLCRIQAELGEAALCKTCREFPRLTHDYGSFVEQQLELSCPEAVRLILTADDTPIICQQPGGTEADYEENAMAILLESRAEALEFLHNTPLGVGEALAVLLIYGHGVQAWLDGGQKPLLDCEADLNRAKKLAKPSSFGGLVAFYQDLEIMTDSWAQRLAAPLGGAWTEAHRRLARYFINRYWLQAVSDYDLVSRVKLVIASCLMIRGLGGDTAATAQLYSKEIENDADNVDALLDGAYCEAALTDVALLGQLLEV